MKLLYCIIVISLFSTPLFAADLIITGANSGSEGNPTVYNGGNYERLTIDDASYVTLRNLNFLSQNYEQVTGIALAAIRNSDHITIENCTFDGLVTGEHSNAACAGININHSSYVTIEDSTISQIADDPIAMWGGITDITLRGNTITEAYSCGTDGGCGPCVNGHSDGIEAYNTTNLLIEDNFIHLENCTSCLITGQTNNNLILRNNVFYAPGSGFVIYVYNDINTVKIYNNTLWNGSYGGIALGGASVNDAHIYNNILHNIHYNHFGGTQQPDHYIDNNQLGNTGYGYTPNTNDFVDNDPEFTVVPALFGSRVTNPTKEDFQLTVTSPGIDKGATGIDGLPNYDIVGTLRGSKPDLGAWELKTNSPIAEQIPISAVTASSHDGNIPENTIDNNLNTRWSAEGDGEWLEFDLESEFTLSKLLIAFHQGNQRTATFDIQATYDKEQWTSIYSGTSSGTTLEQEQFVVQSFTARYVRIVGHGNSSNAWNSITEVDLIGTASERIRLSPPLYFRIMNQ